jgi:hypothetical protein
VSEQPLRPWSDFALAGDDKSLDPDHPVNANLRNNGIGLVPNVIRRDPAAKVAVVGCGAIMAMVPLPYGWHVIDDGRRVLVFDAGGKVQVNFQMIDAGGLSGQQVVQQVLAQVAEAHPDVKVAVDEMGGMAALILRDLPVTDDNGNTELLAQVFLYQARPGGRFLEIRSTAFPDDLTRVGDMVERMLAEWKWIE